MYGIQDDLAAKLKALQEENLTLRNKVLSSNEQIFELQASIMTSDAEAKFYVETELKKIQSETNFRNKEFANLNREHQTVLKELAQARQTLKASATSGNGVVSGSNVITPSQLAARNNPVSVVSTVPVVANGNGSDRMTSTSSSELSVVNTSTNCEAGQTPPKKFDSRVDHGSSSANVSSFLLAQYHTVLMSLSSIDITSVSTIPSNSVTSHSETEATTPRSHGKKGGLTTNTSSSSSRLSPSSLLKMKSSLQKVSDRDAIQESWNKVNDLVTLISNCFYGIHLQNDGVADLSVILVHLLALGRALLTIAQTKTAASSVDNAEQSSKVLIVNELVSLRLCLTLIFSTLSFLDNSTALSDTIGETSEELTVVGNLSRKFELVAAASSMASEEHRSSSHRVGGVKRKLDSVVSELSTVAPVAAHGIGGRRKRISVLNSIKLPNLSQDKVHSLQENAGKDGSESSSRNGRSYVCSSWAVDFCTLCRDIVAVCIAIPSAEAEEQIALIVKVLSDISLVLFHRNGVSPRDSLPCLTSASDVSLPSVAKAAPLSLPAVLSMLQLRTGSVEYKSHLIGMLSLVLVDRRVFHEVVQDEERRLSASSATLLTSTGSESGRSNALTSTNINNNVIRDVDEEDTRLATTSTDGGELQDKATLGSGKADREFLHVLAGLLVQGGELDLQNRVVMLLQDLLSCHGCQFISWLVGRSAEDILSSAGEIGTNSIMDVTTAASHSRHVATAAFAAISTATAAGSGGVSSSSHSGRTPNKRGSGASSLEASDLLTPLPSSAVTPGSAGSAVSHVKLPMDFQSFAENSSMIDRVCINRLVDALKTSTRLLDTWRQGHSSGEQRLHCLLVHRLVNLFNGIAGRMSPNDWSTLIADRNDFINAFLNRSYVNRLHPDVIIRSEQIEYLDRECD